MRRTLERKGPDKLEGIQYNGENIAEVVEMYGYYGNVGFHIRSRTIQVQGKEIKVGDWVVKDEDAVRIVPRGMFNKKYIVKDVPEGYKLIDPFTGKEVTS